MGLYWMNMLKFMALGALGIAIASPNRDPYSADKVITRDVLIIGGGSTGTYTAIQLKDLGKSVVMVEAKDRLGGHTETYRDPATNETIDIGVRVFRNDDLVKKYFGRFKVPLVPFSYNVGSGKPLFVDLRTGKPVPEYTTTGVANGLQAFAAQLAKYPYLEEGYELPDPVPADLYRPFADFLKKYPAIAPAAATLFTLNQGIGNPLQTATIYWLKYTSLTYFLSNFSFLTTERHDNSEIYEKAQAELGKDVLLQSHIVTTHRDPKAKYAKIYVQTPSGRILIRAKKIVLTIPPTLKNLQGFDICAEEKSLFQQFQSGNYYTSLLRNTGIDQRTSINNIGANTPYNLPPLPGIYSIQPTINPNLTGITYGSSSPLSSKQVKANILADVARLRTAGTLNTSADPEFAVFSAHVPFELTVSPAAIRDGFYKKLNALQGIRHTYYTGATFHTHDSSRLWRFTQNLIPRIAAWMGILMGVD